MIDVGGGRGVGGGDTEGGAGRVRAVVLKAAMTHSSFRLSVRRKKRLVVFFDECEKQGV